MSVMRLTMIVHSVDGDGDGSQEAEMQTIDLPDAIDPHEAYELMRRLTTHVDDELKAMTEDGPACSCATNADGSGELPYDADCPVHGEGAAKPSYKGDGWPK